MRHSHLLCCLVLLCACQPDRDQPGGGDNGTRCGGGPSSAGCSPGRRCVDGACVPDLGVCKSDNDCINDSYCSCPPDVAGESCLCVPWGTKPRGTHDPRCAGQAFTPEEFEAPVVKCQWPPAGMPGVDVLNTPLVIDLDKDGQPEILFQTGVGIGAGGRLVALSGKDCSVKFDKQLPITGCTHLAAGDLDGDGFPEIIAQAPGITVYDHQGNRRAAINGPGLGLCSFDFPPAIANVDGMGPPEIVAGGHVSRFLPGPDRLELLWSAPLVPSGWGIVSVPVDLDGDGKMEVVAGNLVLDGLTGKDRTPSVMKGLGGGYPAIGDFNMDGHPDIVLVSSNRPEMGGQAVSIIDYKNNQFIMTPQKAPMGWGGPPTVADFDGDGRPEVATASAVSYYVYSPDCAQLPKPAKCQGQDDGVLWQSPTQDESSGSTGSSVFDFNGDGVAEVVYRDECWLRVYSGPTGKKLFAAPVTSGTDLELPVVADTDNDGHAEIVVSGMSVSLGFCNNARSGTELGQRHPGNVTGVRVFQDPKNRWMPSRGIWNQHAYYITNVNDDGSIPQIEQPNVKTYNNFRMNVQGMAATGDGRGDATGGVIFAPDEGDCVTVRRLHANICNRGAADFAPGLPGTFYQNDPRSGGKALCTARTVGILAPGKCETVSCEWRMPDQNPVDLWFRADDDGAGGRPAMQCKDGNDVAHIGSAPCGRGPG